MPKLTPAELSRMKYEKESREQQDIMLTRRRHEEIARQAMMQRDPRLQAAAAVAGVCVIILPFLERSSDGELLATAAGSSGSGSGSSSSSPATAAKWDTETSSPARASRPANTKSTRGAGQYLSAAENANTNGIGGRCRDSYISSALAASSSRPSSCYIYRCSRTGPGPGPSAGTR
jgi:hypothetical protein